MSTLQLDNYFHDYNPKRTPAWRYERVQRLLASGNPPHVTRDDDLTKKLRKYYQFKNRLLLKYPDSHDYGKIMSKKHPFMWEADERYSFGSDERGRFELESRLLARESFAEISQKFGMSIKGVALYEAMFFNVVDRLDNRNWIAQMVLGPSFMAGLNVRSLEMTAKYFGYFAGPFVLDMILDAFSRNQKIVENLEQFKDWIDDEYKIRLKIASTIGATFMSPSNFNMTSLIDGYGNILAQQRMDRGDLGADNTVNRALTTFIMDEINVPLGDDADRLPPRPGPTMGNGHVEPRVAELFLIGEGKDPDGIKKYGDWEAPEKRAPGDT